MAFTWTRVPDVIETASGGNTIATANGKFVGLAAAVDVLISLNKASPTLSKSNNARYIFIEWMVDLMRRLKRRHGTYPYAPGRLTWADGGAEACTLATVSDWPEQ